MDDYSNTRIIPLIAADLPEYAEVIRRSFATVARTFGLTRENCPNHPSFITDDQLAGKIENGYYPFGCFAGKKMVGFASLTDMGGGVFELSNVSVLSEYRHFGYGKTLLDFCKDQVKKLGGDKITIGIIEEHSVLRAWYVANGFVHTGTGEFEHLPFMAGYMECNV